MNSMHEQLLSAKKSKQKFYYLVINRMQNFMSYPFINAAFESDEHFPGFKNHEEKESCN